MMTPLLLIVAAQLAVPENVAPLELDGRKQLFLDDYLIESATNVTRRIHPAVKSEKNPVVWPEEPWEGTVALTYGSVIPDGGAYRMWYLSGPGVGYAESEDGVHWTKPMLGLFAVDGHDTNAVVRRRGPDGEAPSLAEFYELFGVFKDPRETDPERRYKMGYLSLQRAYSGPREDIFHRGQRRGLGVAGSPDGIHWTTVDPWTTEAICDGATHWMHDASRGKYVLYGRTKFVAPEVEEAWAGDEWASRHLWGRSVARTESPDFVAWDYADPGTAPVVMTADTEDPPGTEIYSMLVFPYESVYIGLVQRFHNRPDDVFLDIQLAVSHDSVQFSRVGDRTPFIPCGPAGSWDRFNNSIANNPPIESGNELRFYYSGRTYRHGPYEGLDKGVSGGGIGYATIKRDRFVSLGASFDGGTIVTRPLVLRGANLHLNADCDFGEIAIEIIGADGSAVARSKPIRQDALDIVVEWDEDGAAALDGPVQLRIALKNALLYAVWSS